MTMPLKCNPVINEIENLGFDRPELELRRVKTRDYLGIRYENDD